MVSLHLIITGRIYCRIYWLTLTLDPQQEGWMKVQLRHMSQISHDLCQRHQYFGKAEFKQNRPVTTGKGCCKGWRVSCEQSSAWSPTMFLDEDQYWFDGQKGCQVSHQQQPFPYPPSGWLRMDSSRWAEQNCSRLHQYYRSRIEVSASVILVS